MSGGAIQQTVILAGEKGTRLGEIARASLQLRRTRIPPLPAREVYTRGQLFQQAFLVQFFQSRPKDRPRCAKRLRELHWLDGPSRREFAAQNHFTNGDQRSGAAGTHAGTVRHRIDSY